MKRKTLIVVLCVVIASQIPFAYRRYRLARLRTTIGNLSAQRTPSNASTDEYVDYKGVIHVHTSLGGHSTGMFSELIGAAKANELDFVIMTEHPQAEFDTSAMTLSGIHNGVLFISGNEVATASGDRLLLIPGSANAASMNSQSTQQIVEQQNASGGLSFVAYPGESQNWQTTTPNGVEVYNLFTNTKQTNRLVLFFDGLWSYRSYADLMFANFFARPDENLRQWDAVITQTNRKLVAIAGNDAHSNIGLSLDDETGKELIGIKLDPYERSFRTVRTHVLIRKERGLSRESVIEALAQGHCYVSYDLFSDATGFRFSTSDGDKIMGDDLTTNNSVKLLAKSPLMARFQLMKNGIAIDEKTGLFAEFTPTGTGAYRIEASLTGLTTPAAGKPWVISNPIYLR